MQKTRRIRTAAFMDELSPSLAVSLPAFVAIGIRLICLRFVQLAGHDKPVNVINLTSAERGEVKGLCGDHGVEFASLGSPIGKEEILGPQTQQAYQLHLDKVVRPAAEAAVDFGIKKIRIFGGYYTANVTNRAVYFNQGTDRLRGILDVLEEAGLVAMVENERGLFVQTPTEGATLCGNLHRRSLGLIYDGGNLVNIGHTEEMCAGEIEAGARFYFELHLKDLDPNDPALVAGRRDGRIPLEKELTQFRVVGDGGGAYHNLYRSLPVIAESTFARLDQLGLPLDLNLVLEPHMDKSEQFFGYTSAANFRLAYDAHVALAAQYGIQLS